MANQRVVFALSILFFVSLASAAGLTPGNILLSRFTKTIDNTWGIVQIDELTTAGGVVQTISTGCLLSNNYAGGLSFNRDFTTVAISCFDQNGGLAPTSADPPIAVAIKAADGSIDKSYVSRDLWPGSVNPMSALVDGRRYWIGTDYYHLVSGTRNGPVIDIDAIAVNTQKVTDMYMYNDTFYLGGATDTPFFVGSVVGGVPLSAATVTPVITNQSTPNPYASTTPNRFYLYSPEEIYGTTESGVVFKIYYKNGQWLSYYYDGLAGQYIGTGIVAADVGGYRRLYVIMNYFVLFSMQDTGTQITSVNVVKMYYNQQVVMDVDFVRAPLATCSDNIMNQDETDVDCGGYSCTPCKGSLKCVLNEDCLNGNCTNNVCIAPTCSDSIQNQNETDVDCGGNNCAPCAAGLMCLVDSDCASSVCTQNTCQSPACNDLVKNGQETDVDCGGPTCIVCNIGEKCLVNSDCVSNNCDSNICSAAAPVGASPTPIKTPVSEPVAGPTSVGTPSSATPITSTTPTSEGSPSSTTPVAQTPTTSGVPTSKTPVAQTPRSLLVSSGSRVISSACFVVVAIALTL